MTPEEQALTHLANQYNAIRDNFDALLAQCETPTQRRQLGDALNEALTNWVEAQNRIFDESESLIATLVNESGEAEESIKDSIENFEDIKKTLNTLTRAVKTVATIVSALS